MKAMLFDKPGARLREAELPTPRPAAGHILLRVSACGVCRTDLHVCQGDLPRPKLPLVLGHEIVGTVVELGAAVEGIERGQRVGVPWLGSTCGHCKFCRSGRENLCDDARFTGYDIDGGYAQFTVAHARYCFPIPDRFDDAEAAPLLCAGLIGYRSLRMTGDSRRVGMYGFGAAAHIVAQIAVGQGREIYAFTRPGDERGQEFARGLGAVWAGGSDEAAPERLDAAILFAPVGALVPRALSSLEKGGVVVCAGIHMSEIPAFPYELLWEERSVRSVTNLTREDGNELLQVAAELPVRTTIEPFALDDANEALERLDSGRIEGAAVLLPNGAEGLRR